MNAVALLPPSCNAEHSRLEYLDLAAVYTDRSVFLGHFHLDLSHPIMEEITPSDNTSRAFEYISQYDSALHAIRYLDPARAPSVSYLARDMISRSTGVIYDKMKHEFTTTAYNFAFEAWEDDHPLQDKYIDFRQHEPSIVPYSMCFRHFVANYAHIQQQVTRKQRKQKRGQRQRINRTRASHLPPPHPPTPSHIPIPSLIPSPTPTDRGD